MSGKKVSARGKRLAAMNTALREAKGWYTSLLEAYHMGRGDREKAVRGRISDETGVPESYLFRLQYKFNEMRDISGEAYRRIKLGYEELCERNEAAAREYEARRIRMGNRRNAVNQEPDKAMHRMVQDDD